MHDQVRVFGFEDEKMRSRLVAATAPISSNSVFGDMVWDRSEYVDRTKRKGAIIRWGYLFDRFGSTHGHVVVSIKEFAYALLFDPIEDDLQKDTKTALNHVSSLGDFLEFLQVSHLYDVAEFEQGNIRDYVQWLLQWRQTRVKGEDTQKACLLWMDHRVRAVQTYYRYRKRVSQPLTVNPLHGESVYQFHGTTRPKRGDNRTPVIPKNVWDRYFCAALDYVEHYAVDILAGQAVLERVRTEVLPSYIDLPEFDAYNFNRDRTAPILKDLRHDFVKNPVTGQAWRSGWQGVVDVLREIRALHDACLIVIGGLSGMRETELSLTEIDGFWEYSASEPPTERYRITSRLTKGQQDKKEEWEVNEPVLKACRLVKQLTSYARFYGGGQTLFIQGWDRGPTSQFRANAGEKSKGQRHGHRELLPIGSGACTRHLKRFASHLDEACEGQYKLPLVDGKPWTFIMRMLRRSLAGRIAREPFGMIAGMLHYKHLKITTFAGYAGFDPEWIKELHDEEIAANDEFLDDICEGLMEGTLAGGKGEELLREFSGMAGDLKKNAHLYFLESARANLHVGLFNYCMFNAERALCLNDTGKLIGNEQPMLSACHPDRCANSCITSSHLPQWEVQAADARAMLAHPKISEPQRIALSRDLEPVLRVVKKLQGSK